MPELEHRFTPPWRVCHNEDAYWLESATGRKFAFTYFRQRAIIGTGGEAYQTEDEARRLVSNFAKLPALLRPEE